jgi:hypothetical protein
VGGRSAVKTVSGSLQNTSAKFLPTRKIESEEEEEEERRRRRRKKEEEEE